ncbi:AzlC family ABC transporter permease [Nocardia higoensis]|uniref:AzlC family ABC transporter permease n=1 Tax=Nocardia higoensis TaxID=228599 RepID=UPI00030AB3B1|nr:AzlC family ABC transporter permease [Nocardia higoensis]
MRSIWRTLDRDTALGIAAVCLAVGVIGVSYGTTAVAQGFPAWLPVLLGTVVLAGGAEFLFLGIIAAGGSPIAAVLAGLLVNARHLPYGLSIPDAVGTGPRRLLGVHVMNDEAVAMALAESDHARRKAVYWACGLGVLAVWPLGAALGVLLGTLVPDTAALGLDAVFPAVLLALVLPALRDRATFGAVAIGTAAALLSSPFLPAGLPVLLALTGLAYASFRLRRESVPAPDAGHAQSHDSEQPRVGHPAREAS